MNSPFWSVRKRPVFNDLMAIALASVALRIIAYLTYATLAGNDTPSYASLARALSGGGIELYNGYRTPGYPLFMAAMGIHMEWIRVAQHALGVLTAGLVYLTVRLRCRRRWAMAAGLLYGLSLHFVFYEAIIQTEALSNFLMALICYRFAARMERAEYSTGGATWIGMLCAYLTLTRPQYLPLVFILYFFDAVRIVRQSRQILRRLLNLIPGAGVFIACVGGWVLINRLLFGFYFLTPLGPAGMMTHTIRFADRAGPEWREAGNIMVKWWEYYRPEVEESGSTERASGPAAKELYALYGTDTSREQNQLIDRINHHLIQQAPGPYAASVLLACFNFWRVSLIMYPECFADARALTAFQGAWLPNKLVWLGVHLAFFLAGLARLPRWRTVWADTLLMALLTVILIGGMAMSSLLGFSNSSRYALPTESTVLVAMLYLACSGKAALRRSRAAATPGPDAIHPV